MTPCASDKDALAKRLHRIEGQVRGIERMIEQDRRCIDILTQIAAAETGLERVGAKLLGDHVGRSIAGALGTRDPEAATARADEMLDAVQRFVKTR